MKDECKTKKQLVAELVEMRQRVADLEASEAERKQAEEALQESEERYRSIVESIDLGINLIDCDHNIVLANAAQARHFNKPPRELVGKKCFRELEKRDAVCPHCPGVQAIATGRPAEVETEGVRDDGSRFNVRLRAFPTFGQDGTVRGFMEIGQDITERKRAEEALQEYSERLEEMVEERTRELRDAQEQLVRREKLAVLGQLAGGVGHELRNPLGVIKNAVYFLNMVLEEPEPDVKETLEILNQEVATSEKIISSLLDFARTRPPMRRKVDLNDVVRAALARITVPEDVEVVSQLDETLPVIQADPDQLAQVFGNIILNGVQAMPEGGQLVVKTGVPGPEWVTVSFTDTGVGIPEENLGKLFEPLFTTRAKGIGLGLALVKTLVEANGGSIAVESEVGKGSTFTVRLPTGGSNKSITV